MNRYRIMVDVLRSAAQEQGTDSIALWLQAWKQLTYTSHRDFIHDFSNIINNEAIFYDQIEQDILADIQSTPQPTIMPETIPLFDYGSSVHTLSPEPYQKGKIASINWDFNVHTWIYQISTSDRWLKEDTLHSL